MNSDAIRLVVVAGAGLAIGLGALYLVNRARNTSASLLDAAGAIGEALNPASPNNLVYRGVNGAGSAITGRDFSLGAQVRDLAEEGVGASGTGIAPLDFVVDTALIPINLVARAVKGAAAAVEPARQGAGSWLGNAFADLYPSTAEQAVNDLYRR